MIFETWANENGWRRGRIHFTSYLAEMTHCGKRIAPYWIVQNFRRPSQSAEGWRRDLINGDHCKLCVRSSR